MKKKQKNLRKKPEYLLPRNSFIIGLGSVLNIFGAYFHLDYSSSPKNIDEKAITSDWNMVGDDFRKVLEKSPSL